ncbi:hypothetical protein STAFG_2942 [Streptomyces afghaniensis 772]|uniref:Uncharacterized protein n=1 Tax=Streptomyces afghaniensis 772 TaxID=1283301 RepID=S4MKC5_9ACTN|nr:hypothetical protein STAFG_2942 [Streptomyces afghaniensis 772]
MDTETIRSNSLCGWLIEFPYESRPFAPWGRAAHTGPGASDVVDPSRAA